ncbi:MAG: DNA repair protein RecO [Firmicutes bacterium]|nr:DNA repair protein RecO [Bacillota bacterium]
MSEQKISGLVLRAINYGDRDKILTVICPELGKISLIMRGVRAEKAKMKFAAGVFCFAEYCLAKTGDMWLVTGANEIESFYAISQSAEKLKYASAVVELADKASVLSEQNVSLFLLSVKTLKAIAYGRAVPQLVFLKFCIELFNLSGYRLSAKVCSCCNAPLLDRSFFNAETGAITCPLCKTPYSTEIGRGAVGVLRNLIELSLEQLENYSAGSGFVTELERFLTENIKERFSCTLKSLTIL